LVGGRLCLLNNHRFFRCALGRGRLCLNLGAWLGVQHRFWFWNRVRFWDGFWDRFRIRNGFWLRNGLWFRFRFWFFDDDGCGINAKRTGGAQRL
jgi:hypothetical protein